MLEHVPSHASVHLQGAPVSQVSRLDQARRQMIHPTWLHQYTGIQDAVQCKTDGCLQSSSPLCAKLVLRVLAILFFCLSWNALSCWRPAALRAKMEVAQGKKKKKKEAGAAAAGGPAPAVAAAEAAAAHQGAPGAESDAGRRRRGILLLPATRLIFCAKHV